MFSDFLVELKQKEINVSFYGGKLKYTGPENAVDKDVISKLKEYKPKLIKHYWPEECHNLMPINPEGSKPTFFLVHGDQTNYYLSDHFGKDQPFYGFFHYGSDGKKNKFKKIGEYVEDYINQMLIVDPKGPYLLGGFSFGGILAFEIAVELQRRGYEVLKLILIDCSVSNSQNKPSEIPAVKNRFRKIFSVPKKAWLKIYYDSWKWYFATYHLFEKPLPDKYRNKYIAGKYHDSMKNYKPSRAFKGNILLFRASENKSPQKYLSWDKYCDSIKLVTIKGNHDTIKKIEESVESLKTIIADWIRKTEKDDVPDPTLTN